MKDWIKKSFISILLLAFVGVLSFGSLGLIKESHATHQGCPFAAEQQGMCPMMSLEHVEFVPITAGIIFGLLLLVIIFFKKEIVLVIEKQRVRNSQLRRKKKISLYQDLFSRGILNPKAP